MKEENNGGLASLDTLLKDNNGKVSGLTYTSLTDLTARQVARKVLFPPCLIGHIVLSQTKKSSPKKTLEKSK